MIEYLLDRKSMKRTLYSDIKYVVEDLGYRTERVGDFYQIVKDEKPRTLVDKIKHELGITNHIHICCINVRVPFACTAGSAIDIDDVKYPNATKEIAECLEQLRPDIEITVVMPVKDIDEV